MSRAGAGTEIVAPARRSYTHIWNDLLAEGMSARAWGVYCYLLGRPPGWVCRAGHLKSVFKEGRDALYTAIDELVQLGMLVKEHYADPKNPNLRRTRFRVVYGDDGPPPRPGADAPEPDSQDVGNDRIAPEPDFQEPGAPDAGTPGPGMPGVVTKEVVRTEEPRPEQATNPHPLASSKSLPGAATPAVTSGVGEAPGAENLTPEAQAAEQLLDSLPTGPRRATKTQRRELLRLIGQLLAEGAEPSKLKRELTKDLADAKTSYAGVWLFRLREGVINLTDVLPATAPPPPRPGRQLAIPADELLPTDGDPVALGEIVAKLKPNLAKTFARNVPGLAAGEPT